MPLAQLYAVCARQQLNVTKCADCPGCEEMPARHKGVPRLRTDRWPRTDLRRRCGTIPIFLGLRVRYALVQQRASIYNTWQKCLANHRGCGRACRRPNPRQVLMQPRCANEVSRRSPTHAQRVLCTDHCLPFVPKEAMTSDEPSTYTGCKSLPLLGSDPIKVLANRGESTK